MKKSILAAIVALFAVLALAGPASAQAPGQVYCGPGVGYANVCPGDLVRPDVDPVVDADADVVPAATGTLPRTGSDGSLPMARIAIVLIGVGAGLTVMASRRRMAHVVG